MLHVLTSDAIIIRPSFLRDAEAIINNLGDRGFFHLRTRALNSGEYLQLAKRIASMCKAAGTKLVINSRVDIALAVAAYGVQLGRTAMSSHYVKKISPELKIGLSLHTRNEVRDLSPNADWAIVGHLFESRSHPDEAPLGLKEMRYMCSITKTPLYAVGGINHSNVQSAIQAGAAGVAVISGVWDSPNPENAIIGYLS